MMFPRTRKTKLVNHVVGVPDRHGQITQCVVLWESRYWKSVILLGITDLSVDPGEDTTALGRFVSVIYSSATLIRGGYWKLQGKVYFDVPKEFEIYESGGNKYYGDRRIGPIGDEKIPLTMSCAGMGYVEAYIDYLLHNGEAKSGLVSQHKSVKELVESTLNSSINTRESNA